MAGSDYYDCDRCQNRCFYNANCYEQMEQAGQFVAVCQDCSKTHELVLVKKDRPATNLYFKRTIETIDRDMFSVRTWNVLKANKITTIGALLDLTKKQVYNMKNAGHKTVNEIKNWITACGGHMYEE